MKSNIEMMAEMMPSIRAEIARELISIHKMNQTEVSRILGVSQPAVSQYVRMVRGRKVDNRIRQEVKSICERLVNGKVGDKNLENEIYGLCRLSLDNGF